jgi:hypothetical protein
MKHGFTNDHVNGNDDSVAKHSEDEEDDWNSLQRRGVHSED